MANPNRHLDEIVGWGVVHDVFEAEEASALLTFIGQHAAAINAASFGAYFGSLQRILGKSLILAVARMYEVEKKYPLRSIPAALKHLEAKRETLVVRDPQALRRAIKDLGRDERCIQDASHSALTLATVHAFRAQLKVLRRGAGQTIETVRNKMIAHHEFVDADALDKTTYREIDELIAFAKTFVAIVGAGYTQVAYRSGDGRFFLTADAERATRSLQRLLAAAGISPTNEPTDAE